MTITMTAQPMATGAAEGKVCSTPAAIKGSVLVRWTSAWRSSAARSCGCCTRCVEVWELKLYFYPSAGGLKNRCCYALHVARTF